MSLWTRFLDALNPSESRNLVISPKHPGDPALVELFGSRQVGSGVDVSERTAVSWTALASGIRLAAETIAMLPIDVVQILEPRGRKPLPKHPVARVLDFPNPEMSSFEFRELMQTHIDLWGNGYAQIVRDGGDRPVELWPLSPDRVVVERDGGGNLVYRVGLPAEPFGTAGSSAILQANDVLHIRGWSRSGILGERMAQQYREAIGLGLVTELFGALLFGQGLNMGGFLEHPGKLSTEAQARLIKAKETQAAGISKAHRLAILEEGMKFNAATIEPEKAQFLGLRTFQLGEAARILRLPPHVLYDLSRATFSNIEHQGIELVTYSWLPRVRRWETRMAMQLLGQKDFVNVQIKFNVSGLLRGDTAAQSAAFTAGRQGGWLSPNDIREMMDLNPREGGDVYADSPAGAPAQQPTKSADMPTDMTGAPNDGQDQAA
jgi:HK97 family phage portal protein